MYGPDITSAIKLTWVDPIVLTTVWQGKKYKGSDFR